jgi:Sec-independent protein secretion pathway component TatC
MAVPMYLLYEVGILLGAFVLKDRLARQSEEGTADAGE